MFVIPTEFGFSVPQCIVCGYEDYQNITGMSGKPDVKILEPRTGLNGSKRRRAA
jgi:hypothetical protein